jgi:hypothetical protein
MLLTTPVARVAILLVLTAFVAALMLIRLTASTHPGTAVRASTAVLVARHAPGSAAHDRHEYRLLLGKAASASGR